MQCRVGTGGGFLLLIEMSQYYQICQGDLIATEISLVVVFST